MDTSKITIDIKREELSLLVKKEMTEQVEGLNKESKRSADWINNTILKIEEKIDNLSKKEIINIQKSHSEILMEYITTYQGLIDILLKALIDKETIHSADRLISMVNEISSLVKKTEERLANI